MADHFLFYSFIFLFTFVIGMLLERIRVPWVFAALLLGSLLAFDNPFTYVTSSETFAFLAELGMYFLLFIIGFEMDLSELHKKEKFILKSTFFIIFLEAFFGTLLVKTLFPYLDWIVSFIVSLSFATVGEAILIPILDEFNLVKTRLGQTIIDVGTLDDIIEIFALIMVVFLIGSSQETIFDIGTVVISLLVLFSLAALFTKLGKRSERFSFVDIETIFLFTIFVIFLFIGIGDFAKATPLAAILAGVAVKTFIPPNRIKFIESEIKTMCYGFFAPVFFVWVGVSMNVGYLLSAPLLIILVVLVSNGAKMLGSYLVARNELGTKQAILMGIGLSVRFSTSIIIIKILLEKGLIGLDLYSILIASSIVFKFVVPVLFAHLIVRWNLANPVPR